MPSESLLNFVLAQRAAWPLPVGNALGVLEVLGGTELVGCGVAGIKLKPRFVLLSTELETVLSCKPNHSVYSKVVV